MFVLSNKTISRFTNILIIIFIIFQNILPLFSTVYAIETDTDNTVEDVLLLPTAPLNINISDNTEIPNIGEVNIHTNSAIDRDLDIINNKKQTFDNIVINTKYSYFANEDVSIIFNSLSTDNNNFSIEEKIVEMDNKKVIGYDFQSKMQNGTFSYKMTLPNENQKKTTIRYTEDGENYNEIKNATYENDIVEFDSNHFTLFVVVDPIDMGSSVCVGAGINCYTDIQTAINAAASGDTIEIYPSTYNTPININKSMELSCQPGTVINGGGVNTAAITISADNVTVSGCTITGFKKAIRTQNNLGFSNIHIYNNTIYNLTNSFTNDYSAVAIQIGKNTNTFLLSNNGLIIGAEPDLGYRLNFEGLDIKGNTIYGNTYAGISLSAVSGDVYIVANSIENTSGSGILIDSSSDVFVYYNNIDNSTLSGVFVSNSENNNIGWGAAYRGGYDMWGIGNGTLGPYNVNINFNSITNNGHASFAVWGALTKSANNGISVLSNPANIDASNNIINGNSSQSNGVNNSNGGNGISNLLPNISDGQITALYNDWGSIDGPRDIWSSDGSIYASNPFASTGDYAFGNILYYSLETPDNLGWNLRTQSATPGEREVDLSCGSVTNGDFDIYGDVMLAHNWDISEEIPGIKYLRQWSYRADNLSSWSDWAPLPNGELYSNLYTDFSLFETGIGPNGHWNTRIMVFVDMDSSSTLNTGDLSSAWSNECEVEIDITPPTAVFSDISVPEIINTEFDLPILATSAISSSEPIDNINCNYPLLTYPINFESSESIITVSCTYNDLNNNVGVSTYLVSVTDIVPVVSIISSSANSYLSGTDVLLTANISGGNPEYTYSWGGSCSGNTQTAIAPSIAGNYTCSVLVIDSDGDSSTAEIDLLVTNPAKLPVVVSLSIACNDPSALNYNTLYSESNFACIYPKIESIEETKSDNKSNESINSEVKGITTTNECNQNSTLWWLILVIQTIILAVVSLFIKSKNKQKLALYFYLVPVSLMVISYIVYLIVGCGCVNDWCKYYWIFDIIITLASLLIYRSKIEKS